MSDAATTRHDDNVPRRQREVVTVSLVEGSTVKIAAKGGYQQIRRLHHMRPELRQALEKGEARCVVNVNRYGRMTIVGVVP